MSAKTSVVPRGMEANYDRLHFSPAIADGDRLFCSGQIGTDSAGAVPDDPEKQFTCAFENLKALLAAAGASLADVVEMTTFHVGFNEHIGAFMRVKDRYVGEPYPAWTAVGVSELAFGALAEIKVVARLSAGS